MPWNSSGFLKHYIQLILEGKDPENFLNFCIRRGLCVREVIYESDRKLRFTVSARDYSKIKKMAGNRYKISVAGQGGFWYRSKGMRYKKAFLAGIIIFAGLLYYQSLFISEIQVDGYESVNEPAIRNTMKEAGLYEGCRKKIDLNKVKLHLYDEYDVISWVGIKYEGNLARVSIAEGGQPYKTEDVEDNKPCNIVADRDGYIDSIIPREGMRAVEDGTFVKAGTVIISGTVPLESTAYGTEGENVKESYVHASGTVKARIPVRLTYYRTSYDTIKTSAGRKIWSISVNDHDFIQQLLPYKTSSVKHVDIINTVRPFRLKLQLVCTEKVTVSKKKISEKELKNQVLNQIHEYVEENLPEDTEILNKSLNFVQEKNIITIGVTLETLQQIGIEEEIIIDKSNRKSEKDDDQ